VKLGIINCWKCAGLMSRLARVAVWIAVLTPLAVVSQLPVQGQSASTGEIRGEVADPSGAVIPGAAIVVRDSAGKVVAKATSNATGEYSIPGLAPGRYSIWVTESGFAEYTAPQIIIEAGRTRTVNPTLQIEVQQQQVHVHAQSTQISTSASNNASALVISGNELNSLSDDPDELQNELQALAGPSAGPNGGEIYIDGFTGGELPPKSAIQRIVVNRNPFSAQYDRLGYGRIEIYTKPGTGHLHGEIMPVGSYSAFNSKNSLLFNNKPEPSYYTYFMHGNISGPIAKSFTYFLGGFGRQTENENVLVATDPASVAYDPQTGKVTSNTLNEAYGYTSTRFDVSPRFDFQIGKNNTFTVRYDFFRSVADNSLGSNGYELPTQATNNNGHDNTIQVSDSMVLSKTLVDEIRFQYRRYNNREAAIGSLPSYSISQVFDAGSNGSQSNQDRENDYELQNYFSQVAGAHSLSYGGWARVHDDWNSSTSGSNGSYIFGNINNFATCYSSTPTTSPAPSTCKPSQYSYTNVVNPVARAAVFDGALFYQDDWTVNPRLTFSYGVRWETQNYISDKDDWAPRLMVAYALGRGHSNKPARTVVRAGYGWFYDRFTVPNGFGSQTPYVIQTIHENGTNAQQFIQTSDPNNPSSTPIPFYQYVVNKITTQGTGFQAPTKYTIAPHFHAALDMEAAGGVDQQLAKDMTGNVTYIFSQGIHQFFTDNMSAALSGNFPLADAQQNIYPTAPVASPTSNNLQYQSGGFYKENQVMVTVRATYPRFSFATNYTYTNAKGDTSGVGSVPSVSNYPGLDYGRTSFDIANRFMLFGNFMLPWKVSVSPMFVTYSGTPYNVIVGGSTDLTGNNQFNGRPTYAASCSENGAVTTAEFGCLDTLPYLNTGKNEKIIPYGAGTGPSNVTINMRLAKVIGIGPKIKGEAFGGGGFHHGGGGLRGGLSGSQGGPGRLDQGVSRRYSLTLGAWVSNVFNHENLGTPNGAINAQPSSTSPGGWVPNRYFGQSQTLAGGFFGHQTAGNRNIYLTAMFSF
jgi:hypothetical protein